MGSLGLGWHRSVLLPSWVWSACTYQLVPVISLAQVRIDPLQLLGLTPGQEDKYPHNMRRPPEAEMPLQDAVWPGHQREEI